MKKLYLTLITMVIGLLTTAQSISVKSFQPLPMDMTASSLEVKRIDQNGATAALIKIVTSQTGFAFDGGALGIVDSKQMVGEVWVWVPYGSRKITISHQQLGVLRDYRYPIEIQSERTYEMVLTTGTVETIVKEEVRMQYLSFQITPPTAVLWVNDELWEVGADGTSMKFVDFGTYTYRVQAPNYHPSAGKVTVDDPTKTQRVVVNLEPDFVEVTLQVDADAEIWVNDEKKGVRIWKGSLAKTTYKVECRQAGHETTMSTQKITAEMEGQTITLSAPRPVYGSLNVESSPYAALYIDGKAMGETPCFVPEILIDQHEIRLVKEGYADYVEAVTIAKGERKQVKVTLTPDDVTHVAGNQQTFDSSVSGSYEGHEYVDLGLPSGTLWATCNVGAESPEEYGDYFAWGETTTKAYYDWKTYKYCNGNNNKLTKYCNKSKQGNKGYIDNQTVLQASDDAAKANWGNGWCMPTKAQWEELKDNTTVTWTTQNGVNGRKFTASNGKSLFLPAAGFRNGSGLYNEGSYGGCWSSFLGADGPDLAWSFDFGLDYYGMGDDSRYYGQSVRAVRSLSKN